MKAEPQQSRARESQAAILAAAVELGATAGYDRTKTRDIARAAHISEGGMFRHFESKPDLFCDAFATAAHALLDDHAPPFRHAIATNDPDTLSDGLKALMNDERMRLIADLLSASQFEPEVARRLGPILVGMKERIESIIADAASGTDFDADQLARGLRSAIELLTARRVLRDAIGTSSEHDPIIDLVATQVLTPVI